MQSFDPYVFLARIQSVLIVIAPLGLLMLAFLPKDPLFVTVFFTLTGAAGGPAIAAQVGRGPGKKKEAALWESWHGAPTTRLLRHRHIPGDITLASGLRRQVEQWTGNPLPTEQEELADPAWADTKYEEATNALREATRDKVRFPLVFAENVNYGFRRNLWGLKPIGASVSVALVLVSWTMFLLTIWERPWPDPWWGILANPDSIVTMRFAVGVAMIGYAALWLFWVKPSWVRDAADNYARRLMESVQALRSD